MLVVGLVRSADGDEPEEPPAPHDRPQWHVPWRTLAWVAACAGLLAVVPAVGQAFGGLAGYVVLLVAVGLGLWRVDRWCARQYWRGLRDHQS